jgi:hypothetical protein
LSTQEDPVAAVLRGEVVEPELAQLCQRARRAAERLSGGRPSGRRAQHAGAMDHPSP